MTDRPAVTPVLLEEYCVRFRNWGRWGPEDEIGTPGHQVTSVAILRAPDCFAYHRPCRASARTHDGEEDAMPVTELNHYFVRANDLEKTKNFYCDVLGFEVMPRPTFPFPGYWLGVNGKIQVHMGPDGIDHAELYYLGTPKGAATDHAGVVDHIAFLATDPAGFSRRLREKGIEHQPRSLPEFDLYQIFLKDPNGLTIELNFFGLKDVKDWGGEDYAAMPKVAPMRA